MPSIQRDITKSSDKYLISIHCNDMRQEFLQKSLLEKVVDQPVLWLIVEIICQSKYTIWRHGDCNYIPNAS